MEALESRSYCNSEVFVFVEGGRPENPEKNQHQTQLTRDAVYGNRTPGNRGGRRALIHCANHVPQRKE